LSVTGEAFDRDPWLLGCANGVVDLRSGKFSDGDPAQYITKASPVQFSGYDAPCEIFKSFLLEILNDDEELMYFMQRLLGYSLIGAVIEGIIVIFFGQGRNGKSTLMEILKFLLGPLCLPIPSEILLAQSFSKSASAPSPEKKMLQGTRVAYMGETDDGRRIAGAPAKALSSPDSITARNNYDKYFTTFQPSHTLFLLTNWRPQANADDFAFWERVILIDFPLSFVARTPVTKNERPAKKNLLEDIKKKEAAGVLAWLVQGCLAYQKEGLNPPHSVREAVANYRQEEDLLGEFVLDNCHMGEHLKEQSKNLYDRFSSWYESTVSKKNIPSQKRFSILMARRFTRLSEKGCRFYQGVELKQPIGGGC
jgi:putative DNA primase/helicase